MRDRRDSKNSWEVSVVLRQAQLGAKTTTEELLFALAAESKLKRDGGEKVVGF